MSIRWPASIPDGTEQRPALLALRQFVSRQHAASSRVWMEEPKVIPDPLPESGCFDHRPSPRKHLHRPPERGGKSPKTSYSINRPGDSTPTA